MHQTRMRSFCVFLLGDLDSDFDDTALKGGQFLEFGFNF